MGPAAALLVVLDEPTSSLDAETEHGGPHRCPVRQQVVEFGTHDDLVARGGTYAEPYAIQAAAYR